MLARELLERLDALWSGAASTAMNDARVQAAGDGHKYRVIDREGFRAALRTILEEGSK